MGEATTRYFDSDLFKSSSLPVSKSTKSDEQGKEPKVVPSAEVGFHSPSYSVIKGLSDDDCNGREFGRPRRWRRFRMPTGPRHRGMPVCKFDGILTMEAHFACWPSPFACPCTCSFPFSSTYSYFKLSANVET